MSAGSSPLSGRGTSLPFFLIILGTRVSPCFIMWSTFDHFNFALIDESSFVINVLVMTQCFQYTSMTMCRTAIGSIAPDAPSKLTLQSCSGMSSSTPWWQFQSMQQLHFLDLMLMQQGRRVFPPTSRAWPDKLFCVLPLDLPCHDTSVKKSASGNKLSSNVPSFHKSNRSRSLSSRLSPQTSWISFCRLV